MFLGRIQRGEVIALPLLTVNGSDTPTVPDQAPCVVVYNGVTPVGAFKMPAIDPLKVTGLFCHHLQVGGGYTAGMYRAVFTWKISSSDYSTTKSFEVLVAGSVDGSGIAMTTFRLPGADFALVQGRSGRIKRFRNPRAV